MVKRAVRKKRVWFALTAQTDARIRILALALESEPVDVVERAVAFFWRAMGKDNVLIGLLREDAMARGEETRDG